MAIAKILAVMLTTLRLVRSFLATRALRGFLDDFLAVVAWRAGFGGVETGTTAVFLATVWLARPNREM